MNDDINLKNQIKHDGWKNLMTGLGTKADKSKGTRNVQNIIISDSELEAIYSDDGLGARIVDLLPDDMLRQGWSYDFKSEKEDMEQVSRIYDEVFEKIKAHNAISKAFKWARLYGGSIIIIGAYDGKDLSEPLSIRQIKDIENLKVIARPNIEYGSLEFQTDTSKPRFGEIEYYNINFKIGNNYKMARVHWSRVIEFHGIEIPSTNQTVVSSEYKYWGIPVLQRVKERLGDVGSSFGGISNLMQEISVGKYKFKDLAEILSAEDGEKMIQNRVQVMDVMKSVFHSIYMDSEDDYIRDNISLAGVSEVLYQFFTVISASTGYPMTRLFGISPGGLNSTGDSDTYSYYDMVKSKQTLELKPVLNRLVSIISEWKNIEKPEIILNPLEQMTEKEQAELEERKANTERTKMETYTGYYNLGIMEPYQIEELEFGDTLKNIKAPESELPPVEEGDEE